MKSLIILDTGPLVALLNPLDNYHTWALSQLSQLQPPLLTCEAVITEACFLATKYGKGADAVLELLDNGFMTVNIELNKEVIVVRKLMQKYINIPMSLADACLVHLVEQHPGSIVMTLDSDFKIYRAHTKQVIKLISPF